MRAGRGRPERRPLQIADDTAEQQQQQLYRSREGEGEDGEEKEARSFMSLVALWELAGNKRAKERCAGVAASLASLRLRAARLTGHICRALCIVNCEL